jgi:hypothetical protein
MQYLVDLLDKEAKIYSRYLDLAVKKKKALIANDIDTLENITAEEKNLSTKVLALEAARTEFLREQGFDSKIALEDLLTKLSGTDRDNVEFSATKLRGILLDCKRFNDDNMALLKQSSNYINHMIRIFTGNLNQKKATYSKGVQTIESAGQIADLQG